MLERIILIWGAGCCISEIVGLATSFDSISFSHVNREANVVAHNLSKLFVSGNKQVWVDNPPLSIVSCIRSFRCDIFSFLFE